MGFKAETVDANREYGWRYLIGDYGKPWASRICMYKGRVNCTLVRETKDYKPFLRLDLAVQIPWDDSSSIRELVMGVLPTMALENKVDIKSKVFDRKGFNLSPLHIGETKLTIFFNKASEKRMIRFAQALIGLINERINAV